MNSASHTHHSGLPGKTAGTAWDNAPVATRRARVFWTADVDPVITNALTVEGFHTEPFQPEAVNAALADPSAAGQGGSAPCAIVWGDPARCLATAIQQGLQTNQVLDEWHTRAKTLLAIYRRNRRRLVLIDCRLLTMAGNGPACDLLRSKLACPTLQLPVDGAQQDDRQSSTLADRPLMQALTQLAIIQFNDIRETLNELQASSISPSVDSLNALDLSGAAFELARLITAEEEAELLRTQVGLQAQDIAQASEELARLRTEASQHMKASLETDKVLAQALSDLRSEAKARQELQSQYDMLKQSAETSARAQEASHRKAMAETEQALAQTLSELRDEAKARKGLQSQCDVLMQRVGDLTAKLDAVFASSSWRVTRPMRFIKRQITRDGKSLDMLIAEERQHDAR